MWVAEVQLMQDLITMAKNQRNLIADMVNCRRSENKLAPIEINDIVEVEDYAKTHADPLRLLAVSCAKLAFGYPIK